MNMQPLQGPSEKIQFLINDNMQVKSSWGKRVVTAETPNNRTLTLPLKDIVAVLENQVKSAKSPEEIKRTREMLVTLKKLESGSRNPLTKFLGLIGVENTYDTKFAELGKKIEAPLLRDERRQELVDLKASLKIKESELPGVELLFDDENDYNILLNQESQLTKASNELKVLNMSINDITTKINVKTKELDKLFPEAKLIDKMVVSYMLTPEYEENARKAAYSRYDQLINLDDGKLRLFAVEMVVKNDGGYGITPKEETKLDFIQSLNTIPKNTPLKKAEDKDLQEKKDIFIKNLKQDSPLRALLENEELQKLARVMDDEMGQDVSMQEFAYKVGVDYPEKIRAALGTEDIDDASIALVLMQKNTTFLDALKNLYEYRDEHRFDFSLQSIETDLAPHFLAKEMLDEVSEITSQIKAIDEKLNALDSILDVRADALNAERDKLLLRKINYS